MKNNKTVNDEKLLKIGLGVGKGDLRVEGNFQMGWHRRCDKKYTKSMADDAIPPIREEPEDVVE